MITIPHQRITPEGRLLYVHANGLEYTSDEVKNSSELLEHFSVMIPEEWKTSSEGDSNDG